MKWTMSNQIKGSDDPNLTRKLSDIRHSIAIPVCAGFCLITSDITLFLPARRKQGGSQSLNDNAKGNAKSAGAQLRRYGEQALREV
jgi:Bacteroidetes VLRF1 release factor